MQTFEDFLKDQNLIKILKQYPTVEKSDAFPDVAYLNNDLSNYVRKYNYKNHLNKIDPFNNLSIGDEVIYIKNDEYKDVKGKIVNINELGFVVDIGKEYLTVDPIYLRKVNGHLNYKNYEKSINENYIKTENFHIQSFNDYLDSHYYRTNSFTPNDKYFNTYFNGIDSDLSSYYKKNKKKKDVLENYYEQLIDSLIIGNILNESEIQLLESLNEETLFNKIKKWGEEKIEQGSKAVDELKLKIAKIAKNIKDFVQLIINSLKESIINIFKYFGDKIKDVANDLKEKIENKFDDLLDYIKKNYKSGEDATKHFFKSLKKEHEYLKDLFTYIYKYLTDKMFDNLSKAIIRSGNEQVENSNESFLYALESSMYKSIFEKIKLNGSDFIDEIEYYLNNGLESILEEDGTSEESKNIPFIKTLFKKAAEYFNFNIFKEFVNDILIFTKKFLDGASLISNIAGESAEKAINSFLNKISDFVNKKINGPGPYVFEAIGVLSGFIATYKVEHIMYDKENILKVVSGFGISKALIISVPYIWPIFEFIKTTLSFYYIYEISKHTIHFYNKHAS